MNERKAPCTAYGTFGRSHASGLETCVCGTQARHGQLNAMGWFGNVGIATPANPADMQPAGDALLTSMFL